MPRFSNCWNRVGRLLVLFLALAAVILGAGIGRTSAETTLERIKRTGEPRISTRTFLRKPLERERGFNVSRGG